MKLMTGMLPMAVLYAIELETPRTCGVYPAGCGRRHLPRLQVFATVTGNFRPDH
jgi:hypothetical protein